MNRFIRRSAASFALLLLLAPPLYTHAQTAADLQNQINDHNTQIVQLNAEIAQYQQQLDVTAAKKKTLQTALGQLDLNIKKTTAQVSVLENQIGSTQLQVQQLSGKIASAQDSIASNSAGLAEAIRALQEEETRPLAIQLFSDGSVAQVWNDLVDLDTIQGAVKAHIDDLGSAKRSFADAKTATEDKKAQLLKQRQSLSRQQGSLNAQKRSENDLLSQTKSKESTYQTIIAQKTAQAADLQAALSNLKAAYNQVVNPNAYPPPTPGMLAWPIGGIIRITQYFGDTRFAQAHATVYSGHGHDGLDIAAHIGTPVLAALSGSVLATGDTDKVYDAAGDRCYSFGKWIMLKHANGLNTMYAHLSEIDVASGQSVNTGDVIGYSGETGYATGPHLHFGVYVSSVTKIIPLGQATNRTGTPCANAVMPVPPLSGYLNPLNYLPATRYIDSTGS